MILEVQNGCFGYPKQPVILENINLSLEEGHILAILGPNGIGKTTLLKCMIGLLPWHSGKTLLYGKDIHTLKPKDVWSTISYIPQSRGFAFSYTGLEMVLLGRSAHLGTFQQPGKEETIPVNVGVSVAIKQHGAYQRFKERESCHITDKVSSEEPPMHSDTDVHSIHIGYISSDGGAGGKALHR